jgi:uncharacterized protein YlxW (UPF0749 family)
VKFLVFLALLAAVIGLYFHDKQQTADLTKEQQENADLTQQLTAYQSAVYQLKAQAARLNAQVATQSAIVNRPAPQAPAQGRSDPFLQTDHLQPSGPLNGSGSR